MKLYRKAAAAMLAGVLGSVVIGSGMSAYAAGVTKSGDKLYYYMPDGTVATRTDP